MYVKPNVVVGLCVKPSVVIGLYVKPSVVIGLCVKPSVGNRLARGHRQFPDHMPASASANMCKVIITGDTCKQMLKYKGKRRQM